MASTSVLAGLDLTKWSPKFLTEYIRQSGFEPYMGSSENDIIKVIMDLQTTGATIRVPLLGRLQGDGVEGNSSLSGHEEQLDQYYQDIAWRFHRHAVVTTKNEKEKAALDFMAEARPSLRKWAAEKHKYQIIDSLHYMATGVKFSAADATARNLWTVNNADRVLFGALASNYSATHATALANIDNTADKLTTTVGSLAKLLARVANPHIAPYTHEDGRENYVMFCHSLAFRDLKLDPIMTAANREARAREGDGMKNNPLFMDGDLHYDGVIYREIPEFYQPRIGTIATPNSETTFSNGTIQCCANFLCGAQAIGKVMKQAPIPTVKSEDDYGFVKGVGIEMAHAYEKLRWGNAGTPNNAVTPKDVGIFTVYTAAVA